ncbi:MAG: hypothetical protein QNJ09_09735 [Paracoccaceae bacterium]|nr:hypothetical protein [Paracoccaceae bacterium]
MTRPLRKPAAIMPDCAGSLVNMPMNMPSLMRSLTDRFTPSAPAPALRAMLPRDMLARDTSHVPPLRPRVDIPVCDPSPAAEDRRKHSARGRFLARQEAWEELGAEISAADAAGQMTEGLEPVADCLALGARADMLEAGRTALAKGELRSVEATMTALDAILTDLPGDSGVAYVVAMAHVDMATLWRGCASVRELPPPRREGHDRHLLGASALADRFDPFEQGASIWAAARCAVLDADPCPAQRVADDYEDLIDLAPHCPDHLSAFGAALLPRRYGTYEILDVQARRMAAMTADIWGLGGYAWVYAGALAQDPGAFRRLDAELFAGGLHDIMERHPSQHMANRLAALTGLTLSGDALQEGRRARIAQVFGWIAADHLRELHPRVWAEAHVPGQADTVELEAADLTRRGRVRALSALAEHFTPQISAGQRLVFTPAGLELRHGD